MRELTFDEMDMVSGGMGATVEEITVTGMRPGSHLQQTINAQKNVSFAECMQQNLWTATAQGAVLGLLVGTWEGATAGAALGPYGAAAGALAGALIGTAGGAAEAQAVQAAACVVIPAGVHAPGR